MKIILSLIIGGALVVSGFGQTRNVLVGTNNAVVQPTNFWSADAVNARAGLGLGSAATNPASAFQPSSLNLSNVSANNGGGLTNLNATNIVGIVGVAQGGTGSTNASDARTALGLGTAATNPATAFQSSSTALSNLATGNGGALSNLQATNLVGVIPSSNISTVNFSNLAGTLSIASGGTGATNAAAARQNLGSTTVGDAVFIATNAAAARTALSLGTASTSAATDFQPASANLTNLSTNNAINLTNFPTVALASNVSGVVAIINGGSGATTAGGARTNLGLGWSALTNTDSTNFRNAIGLGVTNDVVFRALNITNTLDQLVAKFEGSNGNPLEFYTTDENLEAGYGTTNFAIGVGGEGVQIKYGTSGNDWGYPVVVDADGDVVRPTNFWQAAPITTTFIESEPNTNSSTNITAARFLHIHSLATNIVNVTNTIVLPTNGSTFDGDIALVVHQGPTNSMTRVRTAGSTNDLVTMIRFDEAVEFVYYENVWQFNHNLSFIEPIYFSGTNAAANAASSRTNLGLGATNNVTFGSMQANGIIIGEPNIMFFIPDADGAKDVFGFDGNAEQAIARTNLGLGATNDVEFRSLLVGYGVNQEYGLRFDADGIIFQGATNEFPIIEFVDVAGTNANIAALWPFSFFTTNAAATTRTNLGLGATWLTNTNVTNFRTAIGLGGGDIVEFNQISANQISGNFNGTFNFESGQTLIGGEYTEGTNDISEVLFSFTGATNVFRFRPSGLVANGDITINQTATNNGLLFVYRTNNEPFLGLANLIASNNTTVSNETLFRVGVAEATNKSAQFGFRSTNTNGNGVAVFSVFGYNALMMVGPSDPNAGTNPIQATVYSISPTNKVMTLISTNTGGTIFHRPIEFETTTNAATTRTNLGLGSGITTNLVLKNSANQDTYMNFSNGILIYGSTVAP